MAVTSDWAELGVKLTCQTSVSAFYNELTFLYLFTHSIPHCVYYWTPVFVSYWLFKNKHNLRNQKKNLCLTIDLLSTCSFDLFFVFFKSLKHSPFCISTLHSAALICLGTFILLAFCFVCNSEKMADNCKINSI